MTEREPDTEPVDESTQSEPLGDAGAHVDQQNVGITQERGGGEFPDPDTPPSGSAPGETGETHQEHGEGQFADAYNADPDLAGSSSIATPDEDS